MLLVTSNMALSETNMPEDLVTYISSFKVPYQLIPVTYLDPYIQEQIKSPVKVVADFNGNKLNDYALLVKDINGELDLAAFLKTKEGYDYHVLYNFGYIEEPIGKLRFYIENMNPSVIQGMLEESNSNKSNYTKIKVSGVHLVFEGKSSKLYYWNVDKFNDIWTSD